RAVVTVRATRARRGAELEAARVRHLRTRRRRVTAADRLCPRAAEHRQQRGRADHAPGGLRHRRGSLAELTGRRCAAAGADVGWDDRERSRLRRDGVVAGGVSRAGGGPDRAELQPVRRLVARHAGSHASTTLAEDVMTTTIMGRCARTNQLGIALATNTLASGGLRFYQIEPGVALIAPQASGNFARARLGMRLLAHGFSPEKVLAALASSDRFADYRQVGVVDRYGLAAASTGGKPVPWSGHQVGDNYVSM